MANKKDNVDNFFDDYANDTPFQDSSESELRERSSQILKSLEADSPKNDNYRAHHKKSKLSYSYIFAGVAASLVLIISIAAFYYGQAGKDNIEDLIAYRSISLSDQSRSFTEQNSAGNMSESRKKEISAGIENLLVKNNYNFKIEDDNIILHLKDEDNLTIALKFNFKNKELIILKPEKTNKESDKTINSLIDELELIIQEISF